MNAHRIIIPGLQLAETKDKEKCEGYLFVIETLQNFIHKHFR
jgi:hypothetical protein